jgi:hypothetical protein
VAPRTPDVIVSRLIQSQGKEAKVRRKLAANRGRNWLLALTLNSFAKLADGEKLSDLEQSIVDAFTRNGFSTAELKAHGRASKALPADLRAEIFPGKFAKLTPKSVYSFKDIKADANGIVKRVLAQPTVTRVDVQAIHAGSAVLADFALPSRNDLREAATGMLVAVEPNVTPPNPRYTIKAASFRCNDRASDSIFGPSNEPYWIFGSIGAGTAVTTRSGTFDDVDSGESRNFRVDEGCIWGQNCAPQDLPDGEIGSLIQLWEHDEGNQEKVRAGVAAAFAAAAGILAATGVAAWVAAVVAGVGAVLQWLLGFLDDDHIADQTFVFTRQVVENQLRKSGTTEISRRFDDGDADYTLKIRLTRFP